MRGKEGRKRKGGNERRRGGGKKNMEALKEFYLLFSIDNYLFFF